MERIFDNPKHRHYGPVRRLWVMFAGLDLLGSDEAYYQEWGVPWDRHASILLNAGWDEAKALRRVVYCALCIRTLP